MDASFSGWQPYGCYKKGEEPYKLTYVFDIDSGDNVVVRDKELTIELVTDFMIMKQMSMFREGLSVNVDYTDLVKNQLKSKSSSSSSSSMVNEGVPNADDVYAAYYVDNNNVINPYKIVEEEKLKYVKGLVKCLSKKRATEYDPWLSVGFCLHNINTNLLNEWKEFSSLSDSYDEDSCDKQWALNSRSNYEGHKYGIGSLVKWAKEDNETLFESVKRSSVETFVHNSVVNGTDADYLIAKVIHKFFEDEYISMNVKDEWYYFNGIRWERTIEGTILRMSVHEKMWKVYHEYEPKYVE
jgi:Primase C terminal 2 (PriCT-2).